MFSCVSQNIIIVCYIALLYLFCVLIAFLMIVWTRVYVSMYTYLSINHERLYGLWKSSFPI